MAKSAEIGALRVSLGLNSAQYTAGLKAAQKELGAFANSMKVFQTALAGAFAGVTVDRLMTGIGTATKEVAALSRNARILGVAFGDMQSLASAFAEKGIGAADFNAALSEMVDKANEFASTGGGRAAEALQRLGFNAQTTAQALKDPAAMLREIIGRMQQLDKASQIRLSGDLFGNAGGERFLQILDLGKIGIQQLERQAINSGTIISDAAGRQAEELDRKFMLIQTRMEQWWKKMVVEISGDLSKWNSDPRLGMVPLFGQWDTGDSSTAPKGPNGRGRNRPAIGSNWGPLPTLPSALANIAGIGGSGTTTIPTIKIDTTGATKAIEALDLGLDGFNATMERTNYLGETIADGLASSFANMTSAIFEGKNGLDAFAQGLKGIGNQLVNSALQGIFRAALGGLTGGFGAPSFVGSGFGAYGMYASGIESAPRGLAWVGEQGPELMNFHGGESVLPAPQSAAVAGGPVMHFEIHGSRQDAAAIANLVRNEVSIALRTYERNPDRI